MCVSLNRQWQKTDDEHSLVLKWRIKNKLILKTNKKKPLRQTPFQVYKVCIVIRDTVVYCVWSTQNSVIFFATLYHMSVAWLRRDWFVNKRRQRGVRGNVCFVYILLYAAVFCIVHQASVTWEVGIPSITRSVLSRELYELVL